MSKVVRVRLEKKGISMTKSNFTTTMNNLRQEKKEEKNNNSIFSIDEQKFQKYFKIIQSSGSSSGYSSSSKESQFLSFEKWPSSSLNTNPLNNCVINDTLNSDGPSKNSDDDEE